MTDTIRKPLQDSKDNKEDNKGYNRSVLARSKHAEPFKPDAVVMQEPTPKPKPPTPPRKKTT